MMPLLPTVRFPKCVPSPVISTGRERLNHPIRSTARRTTRKRLASADVTLARSHNLRWQSTIAVFASHVKVTGSCARALPKRF